MAPSTKLRRGKPKGRRGRGALAKLNERQRRFVSYYIQLLNATQAYLAAGYAANGAAQNASLLLRNHKVAAAVEQELDRVGLTRGRLEGEFAKMALSGDVADYEDFLTGKVTMAELRKRGVDTQLLRSVSVGQGGTLRVEMYDRLRALGDLARVRGMLVERRQVTHDHRGELLLRYSEMSDDELRRLAVVTDAEIEDDDEREDEE